ncbi:hypothetical protein Trydic_g21713 [Trypoxylus dichotomus]
MVTTIHVVTITQENDSPSIYEPQLILDIQPDVITSRHHAYPKQMDTLCLTNMQDIPIIPLMRGTAATNRQYNATYRRQSNESKFS